MTTPLLSNKTHLLRLFTATFLLALFALASCNKDDDETPRIELLTSGTWNFSRVAGIQPPGVVDPSEIDDIFLGFKITFNSDGTYSGEINDPSDPIFNGIWEADTAVTEITLDPGTADAQTLTVNELTASSLQLVITFEVDETTGATLSVTVAFTH